MSLYAWEASNTDDEGVLRLSYLLPRFSTSPWLPEWLGQWITFLILFNNFVPISLYVSIELVHYVQAYLINTDVKIYDAETDTPAQARTSNLNEGACCARVHTVPTPHTPHTHRCVRRPGGHPRAWARARGGAVAPLL